MASNQNWTFDWENSLGKIVLYLQTTNMDSGSDSDEDAGYESDSKAPNAQVGANFHLKKQTNDTNVSKPNTQASDGRASGLTETSVPGPPASSKYLPATVGVIYKIVSPSGKAYVGQTVQRLAKRMKAHQDRTTCHALASAIKKYGWDAMKVSVVLRDVPLAQLDEKEDQMIKEHNTMTPNGYNLIRVKDQPYRGVNHVNCAMAVRSFHSKNPGSARKKQNKTLSIESQRQTWFDKLLKQVSILLTTDPREARKKISLAKCGARWAAKQASVRCAGTNRNPLKEFEKFWGRMSIDDVVRMASELSPSEACPGPIKGEKHTMQQVSDTTKAAAGASPGKSKACSDIPSSLESVCTREPIREEVNSGFESDSSLEDFWWCTGNRLPRRRAGGH